MPDTRPDWIRQCLDSVHDAAAHAGYPVEVHVVAGVLGHIGRGRVAGYALGCYPYVTSVDDDDWVDSDAFAMLAETLETSPVAATTRSMAYQNGRSWVLNWRENLRVLRRDVAASARLEDWPIYDGPAMLHHADGLGEIVEIAKPVYHYRFHLSHHRKLCTRVGTKLTAQARALPMGLHLSRSFRG